METRASLLPRARRCGSQDRVRARFQPRVAHLDADAFYVSIELTRRPELRGKPVIVAGSGPRAVVTTASYEARQVGVGSAMPAARARRLCPQAIVLPPDFPTYRAVSREVMDLVRAHVERVEVVGLDEAYLDLTGLHSPRAAMRRLLAEIRRATQLTTRSASARTSSSRRSPPTPRSRPASSCSRASRPARASPTLRPALIPGIGPKTAARLAALGLTTLAAVGAAPERVLVECFGPNHGLELARRARFEHEGAVGAERKVVSESRERTFDYDVRDAARLAESLSTMAGELCESLVAHEPPRAHDRHQGAPRRLDDGHARALDRRPTSDYETVFAVALRLLREYAPPRPVRLLGVRVAGLTHGERSPGGRPRRAFGAARPAAPQLALPASAGAE